MINIVTWEIDQNIENIEHIEHIQNIENIEILVPGPIFNQNIENIGQASLKSKLLNY